MFTVSLATTWQVVEILRAGGTASVTSARWCAFNVSVVAGRGDRQESGSHGMGGRQGIAAFLNEAAGRRPLTTPIARRWSIWTRSPRRPAR